MSLEQIINEDFYKNLFRLLHSPKPEATTELKKICDDLAAMYEARGITEYWPPIPGDSVPAGEGSSGSADFTPVSARKFEKPIAPTRKDSLPVDRASPHLTTLRSNSPRLPSSNDQQTAAVVSKASASSDDQSQTENGDSGSVKVKTEDEEEEIAAGRLASSGLATSGSNPDLAKRKSSAESSDSNGAVEGGNPMKKNGGNRRTRSDDTAAETDQEPVEKKPKLAGADPIMPSPVIQQSPEKTQPKVEPAADDLDALACVVCKTLALTSAGNLMVECHGCHNMYHQKCHQPNVPASQISDSRMLWYCSQCDKKNQKRMDSPSAATKAATSNGGTSARRNTAASATREDKKPPADDKSSSFKRSATMDNKEKQVVAPPLPKPTMNAELYSKAATLLEKHKKKAVPSPPQKATGSAVSSNPFAMALSSAANSTGSAKLATSTTTGGLSKLASTVQQQSASANSLKPSATSSFSTSSSISSSSAAAASAKQLQTSSSQMQAAEKRLQQMKKKAAMKGSYKI